jgi:hypothetical protein
MKVTRWNGKPITQPGWYSGVSLESYHGQGICNAYAVSSTDLRICWGKSPAHMYANWAENPKAEKRGPTRAMILGAAAHHLLLGEDDFKAKYVLQPQTYHDRKTAQEKPWHNGAQYCKFWSESQIEAGKTPITQGELDTIVEISNSLRLEPLVNDGLLRGHIELSGFWRDEETGLWIKTRPDVVPTDTGDYCDLKTAIEVTTPALQAAIRSRSYHQQGSVVWEACDYFEMPFETYVLMFTETAAPYCVRAIPLTDEDLARGRKQNRLMLRTIASCIAADHWPGPGEGDLSPLPLSIDERARIDARLKREGSE